MAKRKGGSGVVEGLWAGTAVFAATKSKSFSGFITSFVIYAVILMVVIAAATWLLKTIGLQTKEGMANDAFGHCPNGGTRITRNGTTECVTAGDNKDITTTPSGLSA